MSVDLSSRWAVLVALSVGWLARVAVRIGTPDYFSSGYSEFFRIARSLYTGHGFPSASRPPVYPLFLVGASFAGASAWSVIALQAAIGCATAYVAYRLGRDLFDETTGRVALVLTALYPYYVVHDTALQETSLHTLLTALGVWFAFRAVREQSLVWASWSGVAVGLAWMTRATTLVLAALVLVRLAKANLRSGLVFGATCLLIAAPWLLRNQLVLGAPLTTSHAGYLLFVAHNPHTFDFYPERSIDLSADASWAALPEPERERLDQLSELERHRVLWQMGSEYVLAHPGEALIGGARKIVAGFSWQLNPVRSWPAQLVYFAGYFPISILGLWGYLRARPDWLFWLLPAYFSAVTAAFWAHTSHRAHLDVFIAVFAAHALRELVRMRRATSDARAEVGAP